MKSILTLTSLTIGVFAFSQCQIQGPETLDKGVTQTYTITGNTPDCSDCYHWNVAGANLKAVTRINQKSVTVQTLGYGSGDLVASYQTPYGEEKCSISIDIVEPGSVSHEKPVETVYIPKQDPANCQILATGFEMRQEDGVFQMLVPKPLDIYKYGYNWRISFSDGTVENYTDRIPVVYTPSGRYITEANVDIKGDNCSKSLAKRFSVGNNQMNYQNQQPIQPVQEKTED